MKVIYMNVTLEFLKKDKGIEINVPEGYKSEMKEGYYVITASK